MWPTSARTTRHTARSERSSSSSSGSGARTSRSCSALSSTPRSRAGGRSRGASRRSANPSCRRAGNRARASARRPSASMMSLKRDLALLAAVAAVCALGGAGAARSPRSGGRTEVVVTLQRPALVAAMGLRARRSPAYMRKLEAGQTQLERLIAQKVPSAQIRWRYRYVLDGLAVVVPRRQIRTLAKLPGVARVYRSVDYHPLLDESVPLIKAPQLWGPTRATAGQGIKIGIIDDGVDQAHRFFSPAGFAMPPGFPKGNTAFTTAKVIVARAFPPPGATWKYSSRPFDPALSEHATHVAGIAAGDYGATQHNGRPVSGVAPAAYIGNYKVLTVPTPDVGLNGNSPEIVKGIDAAVADGMDVINLSLGEPEIDPDRDLVVKAINAAADAGVVPAIAAGNDFGEFGFGSISSPGDAAKAITAAAVTKGAVIADFSSGGPNGIDLGFKPDVSAPGVNILSSVPKGWDIFSGTSMASPHVAGAAALLLQRHPDWTPAQVKSALALTGRPVWTDARQSHEVAPTREGGGLIDVAAANDPLLFASPPAVSFRFLHRGESRTVPVTLTDAGGGSGAWTVANFGVVVLSHARGTRVQPRVVRAGDENGLTGYAGLPLNLNPYLPTYDHLSPAVGAVRPDRGAYDVVFDTPSRRAAGKFTFRFWIGDTKPPRVRLLTRGTRAGSLLRLRVTDGGSGIDPASIRATLDGRGVGVRYRHGRATISTRALSRGRHRLVFQVSDYQETKNMENSGRILPNTRRLGARFMIT